MTLYAPICAAQGVCIAAYKDPRLYTKEGHLSVLVPLPREFIEVVHIVGLEKLSADSEFDSIHRTSLVRYAVSRATFDAY